MNASHSGIIGSHYFQKQQGNYPMEKNSKMIQLLYYNINMEFKTHGLLR